jgi:hypothetical protein
VPHIQRSAIQKHGSGSCVCASDCKASTNYSGSTAFGLRKWKRPDGGQIAKIRSRRRRGKSLPADASDGIEPHLKVKPSLKAGMISGRALRHPQDCQGKNLIPPALFRDASWQFRVHRYQVSVAICSRRTLRCGNSWPPLFIRKQEHLVSRIEPHCYIPILRTGHRSAYGASPTGMTAQLVATDG